MRLMVGVVFIYHGFAKVSDISSTAGFFSQIGLTHPLLPYLAGYGELLGGIFMILGLWLRYTSVVLVIIMAVAIETVHIHNGFNIMKGGYEYALTLLVTSLAIGMIGAGKYSIGYYLKKETK